MYVVVQNICHMKDSAGMICYVGGGSKQIANIRQIKENIWSRFWKTFLFTVDLSRYNVDLESWKGHLKITSEWGYTNQNSLNKSAIYMTMQSEASDLPAARHPIVLPAIYILLQIRCRPLLLRQGHGLPKISLFLSRFNSKGYQGKIGLAGWSRRVRTNWSDFQWIVNAAPHQGPAVAII